MELLILCHAPNRLLEQGILPAVADLRLKATILTDCATEHLLRAAATPSYGQCELAACDVFNPLAVARWIAAHGRHVDGVLAADGALHASAAVVAACLGMPGASMPAAVRSDQRLHRHRRIVDCAAPAPDLGADWFPATVQPLESGAVSGGAIVHDANELREHLARQRHGYALLEKYLADEEVYALDTLATPDGLTILAGRRIAFADDALRTKRVASFMARPPRCDELLALLADADPGLGRRHIEYGMSADGLRIRDIHHGLVDDAAEFALNEQLGGKLFSSVVRASVGMPVEPLHLLRTDTPPAAPLAAAA